LLHHIINNNGRFGYIYVDKMKIYEHLRYHHNINYIYNQMIFYLMENFVGQTQIRDDITVYIDQRSKNKNIKKIYLLISRDRSILF